ncbi:SDR family oxidoreductase [Deinococcus sonorensis]|uniref:NAD(P)H-binding protein n=1 Tax=Deinococcus sonorensis KR-87 TaxID=694439 RepID=A0AAU7U6E8_9DEIO
MDSACFRSCWRRGSSVRAFSRRPGMPAPGLTWIQGDLCSPSAVRQALAGADTLLHLATQPLQAGADVALARPLLQALPNSDIQHAIYMSITGLERMQTAPYYREKLDIERRFEDSGVPLTLQRSTQFHEFVMQLVQRLTVSRVTLMPPGVTLQPVEARAVAHHLAQLTVGEPAGRVRDLAGPETATLEHLAREWHLQQGRRPALLEVPLPVPLFRAWKHQAAVSPEAQVVGQSWASWLGDAAPEDVRAMRT